MQDKKKIAVLGVLVVVILGVGAFSFMGGSPPPPADTTTAKKEEAKPTDDSTKPVAKVDENGNPVEPEETEEPKNPLYASTLPQRDPFATRQTFSDPMRGPEPAPQALPKAASTPRRGGRRVSGVAGYEPYRPQSLSGELQLPSAGGSVTLSPSGAEPGEFGYTVSGVITGGQKPAAVFTDSSGNQRLVPVGGSLDGDSKVVSVEKGSVTIEHRGKKQRLSLGGNPK